MKRTYAAIDLKSYYASAECVARGLNPLTTNLVVADLSRTEKTICLAVSPSLKAYGISGRARLFEVVQRVREINALRLANAFSEQRVQRRDGKAEFSGSSFDALELANNPMLAVDYLVAPPRMSMYEDISARIYGIYRRHIAPEDILVYSIDEVFLDLTGYLKLYRMSAHELTMTMVREVLYETGITATAGIGSNLYLAKVAMDIVAKHREPDRDGVRIAELDEQSYRRQLWTHEPITDFWQVGRGYKRKLHEIGLYTMGDIARCSLGGPDDFYNEDLLYRRFGIHAEVLIDHAWGWEPCTMAAIHDHKAEKKSLSSGQVLPVPYSFEAGRLIIREMADSLSLDLTKKGLCTRQLSLTVSYDRESLTRPAIRYEGPLEKDFYGREVPKRAHGSTRLETYTAGTEEILQAVTELYDRITAPDLLIRRVNLTAENVLPLSRAEAEAPLEQLSLFDFDSKTPDAQHADAERDRKRREMDLQQTILKLREKYGKNILVKGMNLQENAREMERNNTIGGHKA